MKYSYDVDLKFFDNENIEEYKIVFTNKFFIILDENDKIYEGNNKYKNYYYVRRTHLPFWVINAVKAEKEVKINKITLEDDNRVVFCGEAKELDIYYRNIRTTLTEDSEIIDFHKVSKSITVKIDRYKYLGDEFDNYRKRKELISSKIETVYNPDPSLRIKAYVDDISFFTYQEGNETTENIVDENVYTTKIKKHIKENRYVTIYYHKEGKRFEEQWGQYYISEAQFKNGTDQHFSEIKELEDSYLFELLNDKQKKDCKNYLTYDREYKDSEEIINKNIKSIKYNGQIVVDLGGYSESNDGMRMERDYCYDNSYKITLEDDTVVYYTTGLKLKEY